MATQHNTSYGFVFEPRFTVMPCLLSFAELQSSTGHREGGPAPRWSFDYSFTSYGRYQIGEDPRWRLRQACEAHLYAPGTFVHEDTVYNLEEGGIRNIYFTFTHGEEAGLLPFTQLAGYARFLDPGRKLCPLLERMCNVIQELEQEGFWIVQGILCEIFMLLHHSVPVDEETFLIPEAPLLSPHSDFVQSVRVFFLSHIGEDLTQDTLANHLNLSTSCVYKRYRRETGEAPISTLQKMRVALVKNLLLKGYHIRTIAKQIGYCDEFHLSKVFKRLEGISPSEFRKLHSGKIEGEAKA